MVLLVGGTFPEPITVDTVAIATKIMAFSMVVRGSGQTFLFGDFITRDGRQMCKLTLPESDLD